jgi:cytochrome c oxidase assembly protein subunit 11
MPDTNRSASVTRTVRRLLLAVGVMFGFGFALVPLYNVLCDVAGINGKSVGLTSSATSTEPSGAVSIGREVTVEFVGNVNAALPWDFKPTVSRMKVRLGEMAETSYLAHNRAAYAITGQAVPSVAPGRAAKHFQKIECFCFAEQKLAAGEQKNMKVRFRVDPALVDDVNTLTLSYTFFDLHKGEHGDHSGHGQAGG